MAIKTPRPVYVPRDTVHLVYKDQEVTLIAGRTRIREGHPIMASNPDAFVRIDETCDYEV